MVLSERLRGFPWSLEHVQLKRQTICSRYDFSLLETKKKKKVCMIIPYERMNR